MSSYYSAFDFFESIQEMLIDRFVSNRGLAQIREFSHKIPLCFCEEGIIVENLLGFHASQNADLSFFIQAPTLRVLQDVNRFVALYPQCQVLYSLLMLWKEGKTLLSQTIRGLWLEFDMQNLNEMTPSLFISFIKQGARDQLQILNELQSFMGPLLFPKEKLTFAMHCTEVLPKGSLFSQIGFMFFRPSSPLRLCITQMSVEKTKSYLDQIGYRYDIQPWLSHIEPLSHHCESLDLSLDIDQAPLERVGLELFKTAKSETGLLEVLVHQGLCTASQKENLLKHPKLTSLHSFKWMDHFEKNALEYFLHQTISHMKVCFSPSIGVFAKSYFWMHYLMKPPNLFSEAVWSEFNLSWNS